MVDFDIVVVFMYIGYYCLSGVMSSNFGAVRVVIRATSYLEDGYFLMSCNGI